MSTVKVIQKKDSPTHLKLNGECLVFTFSDDKAMAWTLTEPLSRAFLESFVKENLSKLSAARSTWKVLGSPTTIKMFDEIAANLGLRPSQISSKAGSEFQLFICWKENKIKFMSSSTASAGKKTRVLIVDDSETIRKLLTNILSSDPEIEIVGAAKLPSEVEPLILSTRPDVVTLDIHMPEMNGVELLKILRPKYSLPFVMITGASIEDSNWVFDSIEAGAIDFIQKPALHEIQSAAPVMIEKIKSAAKANIKKSTPTTSAKSATRVASFSADLQKQKLIAIGSSTGGTEALKELFLRLPENIPPVLVVQHIPPVFSAALASRLNQLCKFEVREAKDGDEIRSGLVLIAPGGFQMKLQKSGEGYRVKIEDSAPVNRHKPSVDFLFDSVASVYNPKEVVGIILTGMGADGAKGLLNLRKLGARTIGQDKDSCVVYGMPRAAAEMGAVEKVASLTDIPMVLSDLLNTKNRAA